MAYQTIYTYSGTLYGRTVTVEIQKDSVSSLTSDTIEIIELKRRAGSESNDIATPIIGQIFSAKIIDRNYTNNGFIYDEVQSTSDLRAKITIAGGVWNGYVALTSFRRELEPQFSIYEIGLTFVDGLFRLKSEPADSTETYFYEQIQEYLDRIGFGYDTYWITDIEDIISSNSNRLQTFMLRRTGNAFDMIRDVVQLLNCQFVQGDEEWVIVQRDLNTIFPEPGTTIDPTMYYRVATSTYNVTEVEGGEVTIVGRDTSPTPATSISVSNSDFRERAELDLIPALGNVSVSMEYIDANYGPGKAASSTQGTQIYPYEFSPFTDFSFWETTGTPQISTGATFPAGWVLLSESPTSEKIASEWFGVINLEQHGAGGLDVEIQTEIVIPTVSETGNTYTLDYAKIEIIFDDGTRYWLKEDGTWSATLYKWSVSYVDSTPQPANPTETLQENIQYPQADGNCYIKVDFFREGDVNEFAGVGISPVSIEPNATFENIVKAEAQNTSGSDTKSISSTDIINQTLTPTGIYSDVIADLAIEYKADYYKLVDICSLKKASQQSKPLQKLKVTMDSYTIDYISTYGYNSNQYRLQVVNENVFDRTSEMIFVEYNYDESNITLRRGIYS